MSNAKIDSILKDIAKKYGEGTALVLGDTDDQQVTRTSSGSLNFDLALGGGIPDGRIVEYYGPESGGKTTMALLHIAAKQRKFPDKYGAFLDLEHALDAQLAEEYGVDLKRLIIVDPETAEQGFDIIEALIRSGTICVTVVDSVAAALPTAEAEGSNEDQQMGLQGRMMGKVLRKITGPAAHNDCTIIFINQLREKVGFVMGNPETTPGGRALKFFASVRVSIRKGESIPGPGGKDEPIGHTINVQVVKNKTSMPGRRASFDLLYQKGIDRIAEIIDVAEAGGFVTKSGSYFQFKNEEGDNLRRTVSNDIMEFVTSFEGKERPCKVVADNQIELSFQGKDKFLTYLKQDRELAAIMEESVRNGVAPQAQGLMGATAIYTAIMEEQAQ